ncbi:retinol dehydrogenase 14-like [Spea bombifrons]|uniref:retinol dehydrogenase 14-like n=1 Tax=Spea bombifrons TaxID=233779 RepID=UPI00234A8248|nr:retinol dehydrogenase 14-like [Spea bombifrons]XP_053325458.1 retinol dehydrogenase 14-like [Spea bombifrons]
MYVLATVLGALLLTILLRRFKSRRMCLDPKRLDNKTVLITGGISGIGKETAIALAKRGARVIITSDDEQKGEEALRHIKRESTSVNVRFLPLNMANLQNIRDFCKEFLKSEKRLDILINNEGVPAVLDWTENDFSMCFGVNHLGPFLLTNLLLERLISCTPSRVITVTSNVHKYQKLDFADLNYNIVPLFTYCRSKLANVYFTQELAQQAGRHGVTACAVHPGYVVGSWTSQFSILFRIVMYVFTSMFFISCEDGAQTVIYCAVSDDILQHNGGYFSDCKPCKLRPHVQDAGIAKKLWEASETMVGLTSSPRDHLATRTK